MQVLLFILSASFINGLPDMTSAIAPARGALSALSPLEHTSAAASLAGTHWKEAIVNTGRTIHGAGRVALQGTAWGLGAGAELAVGATKAAGRGVVAVGRGIKTGVGAGINAVREHPGMVIAGAGGVGIGTIITEAVDSRNPIRA